MCTNTGVPVHVAYSNTHTHTHTHIRNDALTQVVCAQMHIRVTHSNAHTHTLTHPYILALRPTYAQFSHTDNT